MEWFWPIRTGQTFLDGPAVVHLAFWVFLGSCFFYAKMRLWKAMLPTAVLAFTWELFERFAEKKWPTVWLHPEGWLNSYVSDPLMGVVGVACVYALLRKS